MINKSNLVQYIDFLHQKRNGTPASPQLLQHWNGIEEGIVLNELHNLYAYWNLSPEQIRSYETEFMTLSAAPSQISSETFIPPHAGMKQPPVSPSASYHSPPPPSPHQYPGQYAYQSKKKSNLTPLIIIVLLLIAVSLGAYYVYNEMNNETKTDKSQPIPQEIPAPQNTKSEVTKPVIDTTEVIDEDDKRAKIYTIESLLRAEEERDFNGIISHFAPNVEKYWDLKNPSRDKLFELYEGTWSKVLDIKYNNILVKRISQNVYEMSAQYSYYSIKDDRVKTFQVKNKYEFDKNGKIIKAYGTSK